MRILIAHNHYQQAGGEDAVVGAEFNLLKNFGEDVHLYERSNLELDRASFFQKIKILLSLKWSRASYRDMRAVLKKVRPDVVHFHNIFFILTPSVYQACRDENVPVVQSLHNFRPLCSNALLFRNNTICEECIETKDLRRGIYHKCYKKSRLLTAAIVRTMRHHWQKGTWINMVNRYIMASEFGCQKYTASGIPRDKISIKPNIIYPDTPKQNQDKGYALYVGRLSGEKGVSVLLEAWKSINNIPLKIAGDGPLTNELKSYVHSHKIENVEFLGFISKDQYKIYMSGAKFLVIPSVCYENFPCVVVEAYSYGIPIIASDLGSLPEIVLDKLTGVVFKPGDSNDLVRKVQWLTEHKDELPSMRENIRQQYKELYSAQRVYEMLMTVYKQVVGN